MFNTPETTDYHKRWCLTDKQRLDWLESLMRPKDGYVEIYLAGLRNGDAATSFQVELQNKPGVCAPTLRDAIDDAFIVHGSKLPES